MTLTDAGNSLESKFGSGTLKKTEFRGELTYKFPLGRLKEILAFCKESPRPSTT